MITSFIREWCFQRGMWSKADSSPVRETLKRPRNASGSRLMCLFLI